jgi:hypothetical protein
MARSSNIPLAASFGQSHLVERFGFRISHVPTQEADNSEVHTVTVSG